MNWSEVFKYDEDSPTCLSWIITPRYQRNKIGQPAGHLSGDGKYWKVKYGGSSYYAHRVVWELFNGKIQDEMFIDHVDGNGLNNKTENLRVVTRQGNARNVKKSSANKSGVTGVTLQYDGDGLACWMASVYKADGKRVRRVFSTEKYGFEGAFNLACQAREKMIKEQTDVPFTERHGS